MDLAKTVLGDPVPAARVPILRRLFFESYALAAADLRRRVERTDVTAPLKLRQPREPLDTRLKPSA